MADKKISQLSSASTPLAGTEVLPIVQSNTTVKVATDDLTVKNVRSNATTGILQIAGPAAAATRTMTVPDANFTAARTDAANSFIGNQTLSTGNLIVGTAGKGIDFSANTHAAGMTSELLTWYEEGAWTPVLSDGTNNATMSANSQGLYTRIGRQVTLIGQIETSSLGSVTGNVRVTGLPFTCGVGTSYYSSGVFGYAQLLNITAGQSIGWSINSGNAYLTLWIYDSAGGVNNLQASQWSSDGTATLQATYFV